MPNPGFHFVQSGLRAVPFPRCAGADGGHGAIFSKVEMSLYGSNRRIFASVMNSTTAMRRCPLSRRRRRTEIFPSGPQDRIASFPPPLSLRRGGRPGFCNVSICVILPIPTPPNQGRSPTYTRLWLILNSDNRSRLYRSAVRPEARAGGTMDGIGGTAGAGVAACGASGGAGCAALGGEALASG